MARTPEPLEADDTSAPAPKPPAPRMLMRQLVAGVAYLALTACSSASEQDSSRVKIHSPEPVKPQPPFQRLPGWVRAKYVEGMSLTVLGLAFSTSAYATTGLLCTPIAGAGPKLSLMVGAEGVMGGALFEHGRWLSSMEHKNAPFTMVRGTINRKEARLDLVSRRASRSIVRLRVRMLPLNQHGISASGTLQRLGRTYRVNCVQD